MSTKISFGLSQKSIDEAIKQIEAYQKSLDSKLSLFCEKLIERGQTVAVEKLTESPLGKTVTMKSDKTEEEMGCKAVLIATGEVKYPEGREPFNLLFAIEFGAGVRYNSTTHDPDAPLRLQEALRHTYCVPWYNRYHAASGQNFR